MEQRRVHSFDEKAVDPDLGVISCSSWIDFYAVQKTIHELSETTQSPMTIPPLPEEIELHRDRMWRRDEDLRVESAVEAERFIEDVGFANTLTDTRRSGPSLYIAVCGRRDVSLPRNVQKDEETSLTWHLKDEVMRRGRVYYAKLAGGRSMFVAPRLISAFAAVWMPRRKAEPEILSDAARRVLKVLRREHELATADLRAESGVTERAAFTRALDELQRQMKVIPQDVIYQHVFIYLDAGRRPLAGRAEKTCQHARRHCER